MNNINVSFKDIKKGNIVIIKPDSNGLNSLKDKKFRVDSKWNDDSHERLNITTIDYPQYSYNINFSNVINLVESECATIEEDGEY